MSVVCIIPARYNSSRFLGKLLALACGKTILQRTFESAASCTNFEAVYVATDDERIADHVHGFGGNVLWTSSFPKTGTERIIEALETTKELQSVSYIFNLQGDHPCISSESMEKIIHVLDHDPNAVLSTAAIYTENVKDFLSPHKVKCVFNNQGRALYFSRSPIPYCKPNSPCKGFIHLGVYCYRREFLQKLNLKDLSPLQACEDLEQLKILEEGYQIKIALVDEKPISVDTPEDLLELEEHLCQ